MADVTDTTEHASELTLASPLEEIERAVQERVSKNGLDDKPDLLEYITQEILVWNTAHKRGLRAFPIADPSSLAERAFRNLCGYGPLDPLLQDDDVWEICINAPDQIFIKRHSGGSGYHDENFHDDAHVVRTLTRIMDDAVGAHRKFDPTEGLQDAQLASGARMHIVHADIARGNHTIANIRKFTGVAFHQLDELVTRDMISTEAAAFLRAAVRCRASMVFSGAPGSGKTTAMTCSVAELDPSLRVVVAEEVFEVDLPLPNVASMQTRPARPDRPEVTLRHLVSGFLRMAPDVAMVSEVRDREALPLLLTLSSGVTGYTTIHAGNARQALTRLRFLAQLAQTSSTLSVEALNALVTEAVDVVVHCVRKDGVVRVTEILCVEERQTTTESATFTTTSLFRRESFHHALRWTGDRPQRLLEPLRELGYEFATSSSDDSLCTSTTTPPHPSTDLLRQAETFAS